jgi:hypothetical protein
MKETIRERIISLISTLNEELLDSSDFKKQAIKAQDWHRVIVCEEAIFHKTKTIEQLKSLL